MDSKILPYLEKIVSNLIRDKGVWSAISLRTGNDTRRLNQ